MIRTMEKTGEPYDPILKILRLIDGSDTVIKYYYSPEDAAKDIGGKPRVIHNSARPSEKMLSAYGYKWKYMMWWGSDEEWVSRFEKSKKIHKVFA